MATELYVPFPRHYQEAPDIPTILPPSSLTLPSQFACRASHIPLLGPCEGQWRGVSLSLTHRGGSLSSVFTSMTCGDRQHSLSTQRVPSMAQYHTLSQQNIQACSPTRELSYSLSLIPKCTFVFHISRYLKWGCISQSAASHHCDAVVVARSHANLCVVVTLHVEYSAM